MGRMLTRQELILLRKATMGKVYNIYREINDQFNLLERDYKGVVLTEDQERELLRDIRKNTKEMIEMLKGFKKELNKTLKRVGEEELED